MSKKAKPLICLLSPAKTLDMGRTNCSTMTDARMSERSAVLVKAMAALTKAKLKALLGVSDAIATLNHDRVQGFDQQPAKQCGLAYDGPAYKGLAASSWSRGEWDFAQAHLRILSGLYGLLRPFDTIQPYRLDMGTKLATKEHPDLYSYWGTSLAEQLAADLRALGGKAEGEGEVGDGGILVNCASQEYFKAVQASSALPANVRVVTCSFPGPSVYAKKARGMMCKFICLQRINDVEKLRTFKGYAPDNYTFDAAQSSDDNLVFVRAAAPKDAARAGPAVTKEVRQGLPGQAKKGPRFLQGKDTKKVRAGRNYRGKSGGVDMKQSERKKLINKLPRIARRVGHSSGGNSRK